jgi:hypothetical protein
MMVQQQRSLWVWTRPVTWGTMPVRRCTQQLVLPKCRASRREPEQEGGSPSQRKAGPSKAVQPGAPRLQWRGSSSASTTGEEPGQQQRLQLGRWLPQGGQAAGRDADMSPGGLSAGTGAPEESAPGGAGSIADGDAERIALTAQVASAAAEWAAEQLDASAAELAGKAARLAANTADPDQVEPQP